MSTTLVAKRHQGMGALVHSAGVAFRVWAPNASSVAVTGTFNEWSPVDHEMESEDNGYWYLDVLGAKPGDEYLFVVRNGEQEFHRIDPYARQVTNSVGHAVVTDQSFDWADDEFQLPPKNELVIYELHIGTFAKDAKEGQPGTLEAATRQLDHLKRLGINCIEVMPVAEFAGDFSWGYNPAHMFAVESCYGGPNAMKNFVKEAHRRGIGVVLDVVYNHFGPSDLSLWQFDGWSENGMGGIYFYNDWRAETPWGQTRPDYGRPEVRQYIRDNAMMWLEEFHLDGLRLDMTLYMRNVHGNGDPGADIPDGWSLAQWINEEVQQKFPSAIVIAEDLHNNDWLTKSVGAGGAGFTAQWDAQFVHPIREAIITPEDEHRSIDAVCGALFANYNGDPFERVIYTESHDEVANGKARVPSEVMPDGEDHWFAQKRATLGAALVLTSPGIPMLFQGQEFLESGWFQDTVPLDWDKADEFHGLVRLWRDLIHARLNRKHETKGLTGSGIAVLHASPEQKTIALHRWHSHGPGDEVVLVFNLHRDPRTVSFEFPSAGKWVLKLNSDSHIYSPDFANSECPKELVLTGQKDGMSTSVDLTIGSYSLLMWTKAAE